MTRTPDRPPADLPEENALLLPWHVVGRLDEADGARLKAALAEDAELRRQLGLAEEEREAAVAVNEALGAPSAAARTALFARIDASASRSPAGLARRVSAWIASLAPRTLALAGAAAALLVLAQAGIISGLLMERGGARYDTASGPAVAPTGQILILGFAPDARAADITALLQDINATIVAGPRPGGLYEVRVGARPASPAERAALVEGLRRRTPLVTIVLEGAAAPR